MAHARRRLCDSVGPSVFSVLAAAHADGAGILLFVTTSTREARSLRLVSRELLEAVAAFPWRYPTTVILGSVALWRSCFPRAVTANLSKRRSDLTTGDFEQLSGILELDLGRCRGEAVALGHFGLYCSSLITLAFEARTCRSYNVLTDEGVSAIALHCSQLANLNLRFFIALLPMTTCAP